MEEILTASALCKNYRQFKALNGLYMHVPKGAIYGLVGKNGAGKTTLIRLICGMQEPTSGEYAIYGVSYRDADILKMRRRMGVVVETPALYGMMTAEENLKEQYRIIGIPTDDGIDELLALVGLENAGKKKVKKFSLGMKQRLGIAMALAGKPDILILDEPMNGIDPQGIVEIRELLLRLNRERQITILMSSHMLDELVKIATHYGFIDAGQMLKEISAEELRNVCRKCMQVTVTDTKLLARVLDTWNVEYDIFADTEARIYEELSVTKLVQALSEEGCELLSVSNRGENLESYYMNLMGGGLHE